MNSKFKDWVARVVMVVVIILVICGLASLWITAILLEDYDLSWEIGRWVGLFCFAVSAGYMLKRVFYRTGTVKKIAASFGRPVTSTAAWIRDEAARHRRRVLRRKQNARKRKYEAYRHLYEGN